MLYGPTNMNLVVQDILRFHAVYWPAMLMSAGLPLPESVFGHGFLTKVCLSASFICTYCKNSSLISMLVINRDLLVLHELLR